MDRDKHRMGVMKRILLLFLCVSAIIIPTVFADNVDPFLEISKGNVDGHSRIHKFGHNEAVGTNLEYIWSLGGTYNFSTVATLMNVSSTDIDDVGGDTGAWNITMFGLDANYLKINETIQLNGQTPVPTTLSYLRVFRAFVVESGTTNTNEGAIYIGNGAVAAGENDETKAYIDPNYGQTMMAIYTIPANCTGYLETFTISTYQVNKEFEVYLVVIPYGGSQRRVEEFHLTTVEFQNLYIPPRPIPARTDIFVMGEVDVGSGLISTAFDIVEIMDGFEDIPNQESASNNTLLYLLILVLFFLAIGGMRKR